MSQRTTYDVAIIGAGVSGAAIAWRLSAYALRVALIEACADVSFGVSKANSGIIHAGFHHRPETLKARLEVRGSLMFDQLHRELRFPFERVGVLVVAFSYEEMETVKRLYDQGVANGVPRLEICGAERVRYLEPEVNPDAVGGLHAPTGGIIEPYRYVFALTEAAMANGVDLRTEFDVARVERVGDGYRLTARSGDQVSARRVVNAAGLRADEVSRLFGAESFRIQPRKGEEILLDRNASGRPRRVLFPVPSPNSKGVLVIPTVEGTVMLGPTAEELEDKGDTETTLRNMDGIFEKAMRMVPSISRTDIITAFAGLRPTLEGDDFYIDLSAKALGLVQVAGIQSPGLTASPAIADHVKDLLKRDGLRLTEREGCAIGVVPPPRLRDLDAEALDRLIAEDPSYGNVVCRCESVSEAEVVAAIRKGHTTLDGIKFYTRAGMGRCQGGFCQYRILRILTRETGMSVEEITKRGGASRVVLGRLSAEVFDGASRGGGHV